MAEALEAVGGPVTYSELPGVNHNAWDPAYQSEAIAAWLFAQRQHR
jgi:predicted peptidase